MKNELNPSQDVKKFEKISLALLLLWICFPLVVMLLNLLGTDGIYVYLFWQYVVYFIGAAGYIVSLVFIYKIVNHNKLNVKGVLLDKLPLVLLALFLMWSLISSVLANNRHMALYGMVPYSTSWFTYFFFGGFLLLSVILSKNDGYVITLAKFFLLVSTIMATVTIVDNDFTMRANVVSPYTNCFHYQSVFYNTNHYAYYLLLVIAVSFFFVLFSKRILERSLCLVVFILNLVVLIFNNTLGAYLSAFFAIFGVCIYNFCKKNNYRTTSISMLIVFLATSFITTFFSDNILGSLLGMTTDLGNVINSVDVDSAGSGRGELWKIAIMCIREQPLFGCGFENRGAYFTSNDNGLFVTQPHNLFLFLAKHTGIPGLIFVLVTFVVGFVRLMNLHNKRMLTFASEIIVIAYLMSAFFGVVKFYTEPYFIIVLGICAKDCLKRANKAIVND